MPSENAIEIWMSSTGVSDSSFSLLTTIEPDAPFTFDHTPVVSQQVYMYKARRYSLSDALYSDFSDIIYARGPWPPAGGNRMPVATGVQSKLAIGTEATEGTPVKAQYGLDRKSGQIDLELQDPDVDSLMAITDDIESVPNLSKTSGSVVLHVRPEGITKVLAMHYGGNQSLPNPTLTTQSISATGTSGSNGYIAAHSIHTWKKGFDQLPATIQEIRGPSFYVFPGCSGNVLSIDVDKTQNTNIQMTSEVMALDQIMFDTAAHIGIDAVGYDPLPAFGSSQATVTVGTGEDLPPTADIKKFSLKDDLKLQPIDVLNGFRGPLAHGRTESELTGSLEAFFSTEAELQQYLGQLDSVSQPYGASKTILTVPLALTLTSNIPAATGYAYSISFAIPKASYKKRGAAVQGKNYIMQTIDWKGFYDIVTSTSLTITVVNGQSQPDVIGAGTAISTAFVGDGVQPLTIS